jgi:hypothetical protein
MDAVTDTPMNPHCIGCGKTPAELSDYTDLAAAVGMTPDDYVRAEEGTFNNANGHFACDTCYIRMGMPVGRNGRRWVAP